MKVQEYIKEAIYDREGQMIFAKNGNELQHLADIRGWGHIHHLFKTYDEAMNFQDEIGEFITNAINEKIKSISK